MDNKYTGIYSPKDGWLVFKNENRLTADKSLKFIQHSPTGFAWGYYGSGPAQLAFALLLEESDEETAKLFYQKFKTEIIANLAMELPFKMASSEIQGWLLANKGIADFNTQNSNDNG